MTLAPEQVSLASPRATRVVLDRFDLSLKHRLGQHFLVERSVLDRIIALAAVSSDDVILEVGPGIGTLTQALLGAGARVVAIEADEALLPALRYTCEPWGDRLTVIRGDALRVAEAEVRDALGPVGGGTPTKLVSNLPYNVAATIVLDAFDRFPELESQTIMVQREVADRMRTRPGTKDYGAYTVKLALRATAGASFSVPPSAFMPPPHVDSTVLRLDRREPADDPTLIEAASQMADAAFFHRRKTIANSMRGYFAGRGPAGKKIAASIEDLLERAEITPTQRGETLTIDDYLHLGNAANHLEARAESH